MRYSRRHAHGFTLIEMLVVLAIAIVLTTLLAPALAATRGESRQAQCQAQIRQQFAALTRYATDNENHFPTTYWGTANIIGHRQTSEQKANLRSYLGADDTTKITADDAGALNVMVCPDHDPRLKRNFIDFEGTGGTYRYALGYSNQHTYDENTRYYGWASQTFRKGANGSDATPVPRLDLIGKITFQNSVQNLHPPIHAEHCSRCLAYWRSQQGPADKPLAPADQPVIGDLYNPANQHLEIHGGGHYGIAGRIKNNHDQGSHVGYADGRVAFRQADELTRMIRFYGSSRLWF